MQRPQQTAATLEIGRSAVIGLEATCSGPDIKVLRS